MATKPRQQVRQLGGRPQTLGSAATLARPAFLGSPLMAGAAVPIEGSQLGAQDTGDFVPTAADSSFVLREQPAVFEGGGDGSVGDTGVGGGDGGAGTGVSGAPGGESGGTAGAGDPGAGPGSAGQGGDAGGGGGDAGGDGGVGDGTGGGATGGAGATI